MVRYSRDVDNVQAQTRHSAPHTDHVHMPCESMSLRLASSRHTRASICERDALGNFRSRSTCTRVLIRDPHTAGRALASAGNRPASPAAHLHLASAQMCCCTASHQSSLSRRRDQSLLPKTSKLVLAQKVTTPNPTWQCTSGLQCCSAPISKRPSSIMARHCWRRQTAHRAKVAAAVWLVPLYVRVAGKFVLRGTGAQLPR